MSAIGQCRSCGFPPVEYCSPSLEPFDGNLWLKSCRQSKDSKLLRQRINIITQIDGKKFASPISQLPVSAFSIPRASMESDGNGVVDRTGLIDPSIAEVIVVRHGETAWNALGKLQGHLDVDLNEAGRDQATAVAERLSRQSNISAIYSSDLKRAFETAQTIAAKCGSIQVIADQDLRERNLGDLQGLVHHPQELMKLKPEAYQAFMSQKMDQEIPAVDMAIMQSTPACLCNKEARKMRKTIFVEILNSEGGGESLDQLYQRCTSALSRIGKKHKGERVVVVTHGGVIRSLYRRTACKGRTGKILNTSVGIIHLSDDGDTWAIKSWNDISHLKETRFLKSGFGGDSSSG